MPNVDDSRLISEMMNPMTTNATPSTTMVPKVFHQPALFTMRLLARAASAKVTSLSAISGSTYSQVVPSHARNTGTAIQPSTGMRKTSPQTMPMPAITSQKTRNEPNLWKPLKRSPKFTPRPSRAAPMTISNMPP